MTTFTREFSVSYSYSVHFTEDALSPDNPVLRDSITAQPGESPRVCFVIDEGFMSSVPGFCDSVRSYCSRHSGVFGREPGLLLIPGGEECKNDPKVLARLYEFLDHEKICRHSYVVAIGGGAALDIIGYAVGTAHRGLRLIRMPTTVLAQCDSGVGVKNSANLLGKKNFLGTFAPPRVVINDLGYLHTLSQRDWIAGVAEAVKVALIKDYGFFEYIEANVESILDRDPHVMRSIVQQCAELHMDHIAAGGDPFESGSSRPLDFGHWSAHKLESLSNYEIRHGEAVAIGIELDAVYSTAIGILNEEELCRIRLLSARLGFAPFRERL